MQFKPSYINGKGRKELLGCTIGQNLRDTCLQYPNNDAIIAPFQNIHINYKELWNLTTSCAKSLLQLGVKNGDRIGIWAMNRYEWVILQYAVARIGAILVNINPAYKDRELDYVLKQSGVRFLFANSVFKSSNQKAIVESIEKDISTLEKTYYFDEDWADFLKLGTDFPIATLTGTEADIQFDDPINIQYTSGTTGFPKGVTLSHHNILNNGYFIGLRLKYTAIDKVCIPVPFFHCFGMVIGNLACTSHGACMVIPAESFDAAATLQTVQDLQCSSLYGVPTMFIQALNLANFEDYDLSSLRTGVMAGSPCPEEVMKQVKTKMHMREVTICYGMTETSPVSCQTEVDAPLDKQVGTVGSIHDHLEIKIVNPETGAIVPVGAPGELCTRGYSVMLRYWDNPEATNQVLDAAGWMHTGDEAIIDTEGYVKITGRIKDIIIRGGENISPREIEEYIYTHPSVEDVQVIGVPDEKYGEAVMAWVKQKAGAPVNEEILIAYCKAHIAHYKIPKYWKFVDSYPMTVSGKVRKVEMRAMAKEEYGL